MKLGRPRHHMYRRTSLEVIPVSAHVSVEVARLREPGITDLTLVRLFPCVSPVVLGERGAVSKSFPARVAFVGAFPGVGAHMRGDGGALREPAAAHGTLERFFSAVCSEMGGQVGGLGEGLLADGTLVRLFAIVGAEVRLER